MNDALQDAGGWTRHISRDLFPGAVTPYAWTLLAAPAHDALRRAYRALGGFELRAGALWRRSAEGRVELNTAVVAEADAALRGGAWLGPSRPAAPAGFVARLQSGGVVRRAQAAVAAAASDASGQHARLLAWLDRVAALRWTQADLLQVMEELEPHAHVALRTYLILRAGLPAAFARYEGAEESILAAARGLPTVDAAAALAEAARLSPGDPARILALDRYGHRGPGEISPSARRWADEPELLAALRSIRAPEDRGARSAPANDAMRDALALLRAADAAWDALTVVAAAGQRWVQAAAAEALAAGLIARPADVLYLALEELKQVATGEWHRGRSEAVQEQVAQRRAAMGDAAPATGSEIPPAGAVWSSETPDPGCAPFWPAAARIVATAADPWSPGVIAARVMGVPCAAHAA